MEILNNRLVGIDFIKSPNTSGLIKKHLFIVIHDDVGASMQGTTSWLMNPEAKVSYHDLIGRQGEHTQFVEYNRRAWHAGVSEWMGYKNLNDWSIGVCMQNRGGQVYTDRQINDAITHCKLLIKTYPTIIDVTRHKDIAPKRKVDPNEHFPWNQFIKEVMSVSDSEISSKHTTSDLHLRSGAGGNHPSLLVMKSGDKVHLLGESNDIWVKILHCNSNTIGWSSSRFLK